MGLDMYLYTNSKRVCQEVNDQTDKWEHDFQTPRGIAIQWRKAHAIHYWFVNNVQYGEDDGGLYEVSMEDLARLHDACRAVLDSTRLVEADTGQRLEDPTTAIDLLPTTAYYAYDQWYWWDLEFTVGKIDKLMENLVPDEKTQWNTVHKDEPDWHVKFFYTAS